MRIAVLMGGLSAEREVSLESGAGVLAALTRRGHDAVGVDWAPGTNLASLLADSGAEAVWIALHGTYGEDGAVQGFLSCLGLPYTGSGILASAIAMDKVASKRVFESHGIPTPPWQILGREAPIDAIDLRPPMVVKPALEGSSVGVTLVFDDASLAPAIELARRHRGETLIERYIDGPEICTGILGADVLGSVEIRPASGFYDYDAKYKRDDTAYLVPPPLPPAELARCEEVALETHRALGCEGYSRIDMRVGGDGIPYVLEANTLPGMTSHSLLPKAAAHAGIDFDELCVRILDAALPG